MITTKQKTMIKLEPNGRGFLSGSFVDSNGSVCSIQKSSKASGDFIWLGVSNPKILITEDEVIGKYVEVDMPSNWTAKSRMHLSMEQARDLLPMLQKFADSGRLR